MYVYFCPTLIISCDKLHGRSEKDESEMAEQPPLTCLLVLNLKILKTGSWKEKTEFSPNKTCLVPDEAINQSYYTHIKTLPEKSLKHFLVHDVGK